MDMSEEGNLAKVKEILDEMEVDCYCFNEHKLNLQHKDVRRRGLSVMFDGGETLSKCVGGSNKHVGKKFVGKHLPGGTGMVAYGTLASLMKGDLSGMDETGLARWSYMTFVGKEGFVTTVLVGYNPCSSKHNKDARNTVYIQHSSYFTSKEKDTTCPRTRFRDDLVKLLSTWKEEGRRLVVCLDANDDVYKSLLGKALADVEGLDMVEVVGNQCGSPLPATHVRGQRPIDAVWATKDITVTNACCMPIGYGIGDHRSFMIDFLTSSLVGIDPQPIVHPKARRLNTKIPGCSERYNEIFEQDIIRHRLIEKLNDTHKIGGGAETVKRRLDAIDKTAGECMEKAEKKCRKLRNGRIPFSPEAALWIKRTLFYRSLLRFWAGKIRNKGNLRRLARRCKIEDPFSLTVATIHSRLAQCKARCKYFMKHGKRYRARHLNSRLQAAKDRNDEAAERRILQIIQGEKSRAFWRRLNWALGKRRGGSVSSVLVEEEGGQVREVQGQQQVQNTLWSNIHRKRYHLAEEAPICQGHLRGHFGYNAATKAGQEVLNGTYKCRDDVHEATKSILASIGAIAKTIPRQSVRRIVTRAAWQELWRGKKEETSSSPSGQHFGHHVSGGKSDIISDFHALKVSLAIHHGVALERWLAGLCVMLEKEKGNRLISKLRAILLMEADFNAANKIIFGIRMLDKVRQYKLMPEEIFSEQNKMADDGALAKILFYDISRQLKIPAGLASVDAANCYDRVAHAIASLVFQACGVHPNSCAYMLKGIQDMKFFLRTAFGDSDSAVGARIHLKTQGFMQGNGAAPAGWAVVSITILHAHRQEGHGATFACPISGKAKNVAGILYVDDTDLLHLNLEAEETVLEAHAALCASVACWSQLLVATGGSLKPDKCFFHLISYCWDRNGKWHYEANEAIQEFGVSVFLPDGSSAPIKHLSLDTPKVTLGVSSCPSGAAAGALVRMSERALEWANDARNSGLCPRDLHFSVDKKFWPRISYGLCANTSPFDSLVAAMHKPYHIMAPVGGLIRSAKRELRYLDTGFYGNGFPHWGIEALIASSNKVLTHYGTNSLLGVQFQMSLELLATEIGRSDQPFLLKYSTYEDWATDCFMKELWSRLDRFHFHMKVGKLDMAPPREGDRWFMHAIEEDGSFSKAEQAMINIMRNHQQVVYESDVFKADGSHLEERYRRLRPAGAAWSTLRFSKQKPSHKQVNLWKKALEQLAPGGRRPRRLGKFVKAGHKIWEWRYSQEEDVLLQVGKEEIRIFEPQQQGTRRGRHKKYRRTNLVAKYLPRSLLCSVKQESPDCYSIDSVTAPPSDEAPPRDFLDVLERWGETWLWDNLKISGGTEWLAQSIQDESLVVVCDGSYIREMYPNLCSAALIFECTRGRGRLVVSFAEKSSSANAYRGELLGLMAVHLILLAVNTVHPELPGSVHIYSDCLGALKKVKELPPERIPSRCRHADILKNILIHCSKLSFARYLSHVKAHQDDEREWSDLTRESQLNCGCDYGAKKRLYLSDPPEHLKQRSFPLETITLFVGEEKITSESGPVIRFMAHKQEARSLFHSQHILNPAQFDTVAWKQVYRSLHRTPKMFQMFAFKQVFDVAAVFNNLSKQEKYKHLGKMCPCCTYRVETTGHILACEEEGRVKNLLRQAEVLRHWLYEVGTDWELSELIVRFVRGRGGRSMEECGRDLHPTLRRFSLAQDFIGWRRFMEGMVADELVEFVRLYGVGEDCKLEAEIWVERLVIKLLEVTHGQWIFRNLMVHDSVSGVLVTKDKEELQLEIEKQKELGGEGLAEQDKWMMEVNLDDLEKTTGESQYYWLVSIQTARETFNLRQQRRHQTSGAGNTDHGGGELS